jgi:hypothetical protein
MHQVSWLLSKRYVYHTRELIVECCNGTLDQYCDTRNLLWLGLDFGCGRASASPANDTLYFSIITVVACFVWRSTRLVERVEGFVARETRLIDLEVVVERVYDLWLLPIFVTGCL